MRREIRDTELVLEALAPYGGISNHGARHLRKVPGLVERIKNPCIIVPSCHRPPTREGLTRHQYRVVMDEWFSERGIEMGTGRPVWAYERLGKFFQANRR